MRRAIVFYETRPYLRILVERLAAIKVQVVSAVSWWEVASRMAGGTTTQSNSKKKGGANTKETSPCLSALVCDRNMLYAVMRPHSRCSINWLAPDVVGSGLVSILDDLHVANLSRSMWQDASAVKTSVHIFPLSPEDEQFVTESLSGTNAAPVFWDVNRVLATIEKSFPAYANLLDDFPKAYFLTPALMGVAALGAAAALVFSFMGWQQGKESAAFTASMQSQISMVNEQITQATERKSEIERLEKDFSVDAFRLPRGKGEAVNTLGRSLPPSFTISFLEILPDNTWRMEGLVLATQNEAVMRQTSDQVRTALESIGFVMNEAPTGFFLDTRTARISSSGVWRSPDSSISLMDVINSIRAEQQQNKEGTLTTSAR